MFHSSFIILKIQRQEGKQYRPRWAATLWAAASGSKLFAISTIFVISIKGWKCFFFEKYPYILKSQINSTVLQIYKNSIALEYETFKNG